MAKTLKAKKRKVGPKKVVGDEKKTVLVGTYKAGQLEREGKKPLAILPLS